MTGVAVVTGGASGFGLALGCRCAALGMDVVLLDLDAARAAAEADRLTADLAAASADAGTRARVAGDGAGDRADVEADAGDRGDVEADAGTRARVAGDGAGGRAAASADAGTRARVAGDGAGGRAAVGDRADAGATGQVVVGGSVDVGDAGSVEAAAAMVGERFGGVDLVVSNVGVQLFGPVERFTDDEWRWVLDVNVVGSARVARAFIPLLRRAGSGRGRLAFTTSSSVLDPASRLGAYQASKFAVWGLAETLRLELAGDGIGVSVLFPSGMLSRHLETSEGAQPDHLRRPIAGDGDFDAMVASNPTMASALVTPDDAAAGVIEAVLAGRPYVVTHGDLTPAVAARAALLTIAAEAARQPKDG